MEPSSNTELSITSKHKTKTKSQVVPNKMYKKNIDAAVSHFEERNRNMQTESNLEQDVDEPGFVVAENVSLEAFVKYIGREPKIRVQIRLIDGNVIAHELPLSPHSETAGQITAQVVYPTFQLPVNDRLIPGPSADIFTGPNTLLIADVKITPVGRPRPPAGQGCDSMGAAYPTLVVEVGYSESLHSLHALAPLYFSPTTAIRLYLAVKIFGRRPDGTNAVLALLYMRPNPVPIIVRSFGTAPLSDMTLEYLRGVGIPNNAILGFGRFGAPPCNAPGIPLYQILLPAAELYDGVPGGVPNGVPANIVVDLHEVQFFALRYM